jgi:signal transduction histidine kinase
VNVSSPLWLFEVRPRADSERSRIHPQTDDTRLRRRYRRLMSRLGAGWFDRLGVDSRLIDAGLALGILVYGLSELLGPEGWRPLAPYLIVLGAMCAATLIRRRAPLALLGAAVVGWLLNGIYGDFDTAPDFPFVALLVALFAVGRYERVPRVSLVAPATGLALLLASLAEGASATDVPFIGAFMTGVWATGFLLRRGRRQRDELKAQEAALLSAGEENARRAVTEERARIARELHDVIAHNVSAVILQAGAAEQELQGGDIERLGGTLASIRSAGQEALSEMRRLLGVLRRTDDSLALAPQPGLDAIEELAERARRSGLTVNVSLLGSARRLPAGLDLAAYRVIQESLTNAVKHAGPTATVDLSVIFEGRLLDIAVSDDGPGAPRGASAALDGGHGLVGIRERAALYGGEAHFGRAESGGFSVNVRLPLEEPPA